MGASKICRNLGRSDISVTLAQELGRGGNAVNAERNHEIGVVACRDVLADVLARAGLGSPDSPALGVLARPETAASVDAARSRGASVASRQRMTLRAIRSSAAMRAMSMLWSPLPAPQPVGAAGPLTMAAVRLAIAGAGGRMGRVLTRIVNDTAVHFTTLLAPKAPFESPTNTDLFRAVERAAHELRAPVESGGPVPQVAPFELEKQRLQVTDTVTSIYEQGDPKLLAFASLALLLAVVFPLWKPLLVGAVGLLALNLERAAVEVARLPAIVTPRSVPWND